MAQRNGDPDEEDNTLSDGHENGTLAGYLGKQGTTDSAYRNTIADAQA